MSGGPKRIGRVGAWLDERVSSDQSSSDKSFVTGGAWVLPAGYLVAQGLDPCPEGSYPAPGGLPGISRVPWLTPCANPAGLGWLRGGRLAWWSAWLMVKLSNTKRFKTIFMTYISENQAVNRVVGLTADRPGRCQPALPQPGKFVLVQCRQFRCLGFFDAEGKWRNAQTVQELADVKAWCGIEDDNFIPVS